MIEIEFIQLLRGSNRRYLLTVLNLQPVPKCVEIKPVQGLFLVKEQRPLKLINAVNEAGIPLTY